MIDYNLSKKILTVGATAKPLGGISQVIANYNNHVFTTMQRVEYNSGKKGLINLLSFVVAFFKEFWLLMVKPSIKIVHIHTAAGFSFVRVSFYWALAKCFRRSTIMHIHAGAFADYYRKHPRFVGFVLKRCTRVFALSSQWRDFFENEVKLNNVVVLNNVIEPPVKIKTDPSPQLHFLFLGHMVPNKGIFDLLDVVAENAHQLKDRFVLHIGGALNEDKVKSIIVDRHLEEFVTFEGWVMGQRKVELLNRCDVYILPSYIEGVPISILEAMSYGMPIISTTVGGIPSIVKDGVNGSLFTPGDKVAMAAAIMSYVDSRDLVSEQGKHSIELSKPYLPDAVAMSLEMLYKSIL